MNRERLEPRVTYRRLYNHQYAALVVAVLILITSALHQGTRGFVHAILALLWLLPCILFPEAMGTIVGPRFTTEPSHPGCLALMAWTLMLFALVIRIGALLGLGVASS